MALGYIAAFSETLALAVIASDGLPPLLDALTTEIEDHIKSASAWSLGQIGRHTPNHAKAVAEVNTLQALVHCFIAKTSSEDLQTKCKKALKGICDRLTYFPALDAVIQVS
jgi:3-methyladenine DNA glycosylase AlkD